ncbi:hypothetical protein SARC_09417 [Sphaeroforma arctica JP610]|uniref:Ubiquitin-like domain-containing protein n=1 Tax=Sphaeroforma arctica JP610 TaxID=667725 RepID=A0A0L0FQ76_9EUKA|nr:hypothetical protein SARC_09417 [Sphaeroforma arctica JP610]KNC78138.1 hypothetical protein SARC_09417 [Sphaeroforma arctica JP610]|eukprot:XP_014152040.1 hypothetical protein SARC_09417 [Sphaeroforma arctica JP610]
MDVIIKRPETSSSLQLKADYTTTVGDIKLRITEETGIPTEEINLHYNDKQLPDAQTLWMIEKTITSQPGSESTKSTTANTTEEKLEFNMTYNMDGGCKILCLPCTLIACCFGYLCPCCC